MEIWVSPSQIQPRPLPMPFTFLRPLGLLVAPLLPLYKQSHVISEAPFPSHTNNTRDAVAVCLSHIGTAFSRTSWMRCWLQRRIQPLRGLLLGLKISLFCFVLRRPAGRYWVAEAWKVARVRAEKGDSGPYQWLVPFFFLLQSNQVKLHRWNSLRHVYVFEWLPACMHLYNMYAGTHGGQ